MLKKTTIALAVMACATGAQAADWMVAPDHKLELNVDVGAYYQTIKSSTGASTTSVLGAGLNQIQIKSAKTLPNGWKLSGQIELDFDPLQDNYPAWTDDTKVGLEIPVFGRVTAGQWDSFYEDNVAEALGFWGIGDLAAFVDEPLSNFDSKHLQYYNKYGAFELALDATYGYADTTTSNPMVGLQTTLGYKVGDLQLYVGGGNVPSYYANAAGSRTTTTSIATSAHTNSSGASAVYTFGNTKVAGLVSEVQIIGGRIYNYRGVSLQQSMGEWKFGVAMQNVNLGSSSSATDRVYDQYSYGVNYQVTKGAIVFLEGNALKKDNDSGNAIEFGMKYSF